MLVMKSPNSRHIPALIFLACAALVGLASFASESTAVGAQTTTGDLTESSAIAVPFVGEYEVWCTDRNPAPGDLCRNHHGSPAIDFGMVPGTPIRAVGDGVVIETETSCAGAGFCRNGAGNFIAIQHADGRFSRFLHLRDVFVTEGQTVSVGDEIGTSGLTGQTSSAHLHYDEQFPRGTRVEMGSWIGCVDGEPVQYPEAFGFTDWNDVPFGTLMANDGYDCLVGLQSFPIQTGEPSPTPNPEPAPAPGPEPTIITGTTAFAISPPAGFPDARYEIEISDASGVETTTISHGTMLRIDAPDGDVDIRMRRIIDQTIGAWSLGVHYHHDEAPTGPTCEGLHASVDLNGTPVADVIVGSDSNDIIDGRGGNDIICGGGGDDTILGGKGADSISGGAGDDVIRGGQGPDTIDGGEGDDNVQAGKGADDVDGGPGNDILNGNEGNDEIFGNSGEDTISGRLGHDKLRGGAGDDQITGENGRDFLGGGKGDDVLNGGNGIDWLIGAAGDDELIGGDGIDRCAPDSSTTTEPAPRECER